MLVVGGGRRIEKNDLLNHTRLYAHLCRKMRQARRILQAPGGQAGKAMQSRFEAAHPLTIRAQVRWLAVHVSGSHM